MSFALVNPEYPTLGVYDGTFAIPSAPPIEEELPESVTLDENLPPEPLYPTVLYPNVNVQPVHIQPILTQDIHDETLKLFSKADEVVGSILKRGKEAPAARTARHERQTPHTRREQAPTAGLINVDLSDRSWNMFNREETHVHHHHHSSDKSEKQEADDRNLRILIGLIGGIVILVAAFFIGKAVAEHEDLKDESLSFGDLKHQWGDNREYYTRNYQRLVEGVIRHTDTILARKRSNKIQKIGLLVLGLAAGGIAIAGAVISSGALMALALAVGLTVVGLGLFKMGYHCFSNRDKKDAQEIEQALAELQTQPLL